MLTGAASGIGKALALQLAQRGVRLQLVDCDAIGLDAIAGECRASGTEANGHVVDLSEKSQVDELLDDVRRDLGPIDLLINNAGVVHYGPTAEMSSDDHESLLAVNLLAPLQLIHGLLPQLLERPEAHIVNVSSMYGFVATAMCAAYHASKFGLLGYSESLHLELRRTQVSVTTVCPGFVATGLFDRGRGSHSEVGVPHPPAWVTTSPQRVARRIVRAIERRQRLVIITPLAWSLFYTNRYAPWLLRLASWFRRDVKVQRPDLSKTGA